MNRHIRMTFCLAFLMTLYMAPIAATAQDLSKESHDVSVGGDAGSSSFSLRSNVAYGSGPLQKLDIYTPKKAQPNLPILFFLHGGGWRTGDKAQRDHAAKGVAYTNNGIIFVSVNYGLAPQVTYPKFMQDVADAFAYVHEHAAEFGGDPKRIFVMGHSAGAQLVDLLGSNDRFLKGKGLSLANISGVISLDTASLDLVKRINEESFEGKMIGPMIKQAFGSDVKVLADASPYSAIQPGKKFPPFLMYCGTKRFSCMEQHRQFADAMLKAGGQATVVPVPLSHRDINLKAGDENSPIFKAIVKMIKKTDS